MLVSAAPEQLPRELDARAEVARSRDRASAGTPIFGSGAQRAFERTFVVEAADVAVYWGTERSSIVENSI